MILLMSKLLLDPKEYKYSWPALQSSILFLPFSIDVTRNPTPFLLTNESLATSSVAIRSNIPFLYRHHGPKQRASSATSANYDATTTLHAKPARLPGQNAFGQLQQLRAIRKLRGARCRMILLFYSQRLDLIQRRPLHSSASIVVL